MVWPERIAVVGAGYMGRGIAQVLAGAGAECILADLSWERADSARSLLLTEARRHEAAGLIPAGSAEDIGQRIHAADPLEAAVAQTAFVVEAVFEDRHVKTEVLRRIERSVGVQTVVATNTSAISIASLAAELERPALFLGAHWFNPPQFVPGVELIASPATSPEALDQVEALLRRAGKQPARVADAPGFVGNRLQYALFQEAAAVVEEGIASAETVDRVVRSTFGFRLPMFGPFAIADMAGLDVYRGSYRTLEEAYPDRFVAPRVLNELIARGEFGAKTGSGFVIRSSAQAAAMAARRDVAYGAIRRVVDAFERDADSHEDE